MTPVHATIENVSRRGFLKGILATGGLVIAAEFVPARVALAAYATGAEKIEVERHAPRNKTWSPRPASSLLECNYAGFVQLLERS